MASYHPLFHFDVESKNSESVTRELESELEENEVKNNLENTYRTRKSEAK